MQENSTEQPSSNASEQSAVLYKSENEARTQLDHAAEIYTAATEGPGSSLVSDEVASVYGFDDEEEAEARLDAAGDELDATVKNSNDFAAEHIDELHEAALKEAAQHVADVYAESEKKDDA